MADNKKVWLIAGSSTGFGRSLTEAVLKHGDRVVATARKPEQLSDLIDQYPETAKAVRLADAVQMIEEKLKSVKVELETWKQVGINTAFEGVEVGAIGG